jgi:ubiquinone/menaquinone biosynthesis C-methylase UbiE
MAHQDFEKYANEKLMNGLIADNYKKFFLKWIDYRDIQLKVLDYGCGDGKYFNFFRHCFQEENIFGVEMSKIRAERCNEKGWGKVFKIRGLEKLPFKDEYFDFVNFDQVIEHISAKEISFYLKEISRVLKKGGKMIVITPNYSIKRVYDFLNAFLKRDFKKVLDDPTHVTHYNFEKLYKLLEKYFTNIKLEPTGGLFYKWLKKRFFSHKIIGICEKSL